MSSQGRSARRWRTAFTALGGAGQDRGAGVVTGATKRTRAAGKPERTRARDGPVDRTCLVATFPNEPERTPYPRELSVWRHSPNDPRGARPNEPERGGIQTNPSDGAVPDEPQRLANPNEPERGGIQTNLSRAHPNEPDRRGVSWTARTVAESERTRAVRTSSGEAMSAEGPDPRKPLRSTVASRRCGAAIA